MKETAAPVLVVAAIKVVRSVSKLTDAVRFLAIAKSC